MRPLVLNVICLLILNLPARGQQATSSVNQAATLLSQSSAALTGSVQVSDVTLTGTVQRTIGGDQQNGSVTLKATATGESRIDINLAAGLHSEILNTSSLPFVGSWSAPDGISHPIPQHNLWIEPTWFFPTFLVVHGSQASAYTATYVGQTTLDSVSVQHISISQVPLDPSPNAAALQQLSQEEIYLDASTFLPVAIMFNTHPDNNALLQIPVEIRFSDYRSTNGAQVPFHIQKFLNNVLLLDLQIQSVSLNTGLTSATFAVQ
jgi:hypothetical protein